MERDGDGDITPAKGCWKTHTGCMGGSLALTKSSPLYKVARELLGKTARDCRYTRREPDPTVPIDLEPPSPHLIKTLVQPTNKPPQSDFSRYSRVSVKWQIIYVPLLPLVFVFISFIGISATSAGQAKYGTLDWDPMALIAHWPSRAARFFAAFSFALAALGVNISANSLSAANDLTALFPQYVNIRRGQLICAVVAWCLVPWKILASAGSFLNFMAAYAIFLGPIAAILVWDFWYVHGRKYDTLALYQPHGIYWYTGGVNWRAVVAFLVGVVPNLPGFIHSITPSIEVGVGERPYTFGWLLGFVATSLVYVVLSKWVAPPRETFIERAVLPDDVYDERIVEGEEVSVGSGSGEDARTEKTGWKARLERIL
jgi:NCS1 family nucleobase:cation symporter-1